MTIPRSDVNRPEFARWLQTSRGWFIAFTERLLQGEKQPFSCRVNGQQSLQSEHDLRSMDSCRASIAAYGQGKNACHFTVR